MKNKTLAKACEEFRKAVIIFAYTVLDNLAEFVKRILKL